jgi:hypothetical protein
MVQWVGNASNWQGQPQEQLQFPNETPVIRQSMGLVSAIAILPHAARSNAQRAPAAIPRPDTISSPPDA